MKFIYFANLIIPSVILHASFSHLSVSMINDDPNANNPLISRGDIYKNVNRMVVFDKMKQFPTTLVWKEDAWIISPTIILLENWASYTYSRKNYTTFEFTEKYRNLLFSKDSEIRFYGTTNNTEIEKSWKSSQLDLGTWDNIPYWNPEKRTSKKDIRTFWVNQSHHQNNSILSYMIKLKINWFVWYDEQNIYTRFEYKIQHNGFNRLNLSLNVENILFKQDNPYSTDKHNYGWRRELY